MSRGTFKLSQWCTRPRLELLRREDHGDPLAAIDLSGQLQLSDDDLMGSQIGQRITGELGFSWWINTASALWLSASVGEDRGTLFIGAQLELTYGLLDGTCAR